MEFIQLTKHDEKLLDVQARSMALLNYHYTIYPEESLDAVEVLPNKNNQEFPTDLKFEIKIDNELYTYLILDRWEAYELVKKRVWNNLDDIYSGDIADILGEFDQEIFMALQTSTIDKEQRVKAIKAIIQSSMDVELFLEKVVDRTGCGDWLNPWDGEEVVFDDWWIYLIEIQNLGDGKYEYKYK